MTRILLLASQACQNTMYVCRSESFIAETRSFLNDATAAGAMAVV